MINIHKDKEIERCRNIKMLKQRDGETEIQREKQTDRDRRREEQKEKIGIKDFQ